MNNRESANPSDILGNLFLGMDGKNAERLQGLVCQLVESTKQWRQGLFRPDEDGKIEGSAPTEAAANLAKEEHDELKRYLGRLLIYLQRSIPIFSPRYHAHMGWDLLIPGILGNMTGTLFNSNNVAYEGSPATSILEKLACEDLCRMLGFRLDEGSCPANPFETSGIMDGKKDIPRIRPWSHLVAGGSVANIEAMWAARNLKFLPWSIRAALREFPGDVSKANELPVPLKCIPSAGGKESVKAFGKLEDWELLNLEMDVVLALPDAIKAALGLKEKISKDVAGGWSTEDFDLAISRQGINEKGIHHFLGQGIASPRILLSHDNHYSFEKAPALLGLGQDCLEFIEVDAHGRKNLKMLEERLWHFLNNRIPVLAVVANLGSIELGAVDPIDGILKLRDGFRKKGLDFMLHVDGAFGGYHASMLRPAFKMGKDPAGVLRWENTALSQDVYDQYIALPGADSITVDPHKLGFVPFPAGAICYRNSATRDLTRFSAPYLGDIVSQGIGQAGNGTDPLMGVYGVEGSRPGGAASAVFLSNCLVRPNSEGYGILCRKEMENTRTIFHDLSRLKGGDKGWEWVAATSGRYPEDFAGKVANNRDLGPDMNMLCYLFNFKDGAHYNQDLMWLNVFNLFIYSHIDLNPREGEREGNIRPYGDRKLIVCNTVFSGREGTAFIKCMLHRLKIDVLSNMTKTAVDLANAQLFVLRSAKWHPWLEAKDISNFTEALAEAANGACEKVGKAQKLVQGKESDLMELRDLGHSSYDLAMGISIYYAMKSRENPAAIGKEEIREGWKAFREIMKVSTAAGEALQHFFPKTDAHRA